MMASRTAFATIAAAAAIAVSPAGLAAADKRTSDTKSWPEFKGACFEIRYPPGFKAQPSLISNTNDASYDSTFFIAPDKSVEFYIFCPLWRGNPTDIALKPKTEVVTGLKIDESKDYATTATDIKAKNDSYYRSVLERNYKPGDVLTVYGVKYRTPADLANHKAAYTAFKESLVKHMDDEGVDE
jgi:hypothetical protein